MRSVFVRHRWEPYLWILPSILLMLVFVVFPLGIVFRGLCGRRLISSPS